MRNTNEVLEVSPPPTSQPRQDLPVSVRIEEGSEELLKNLFESWQHLCDETRSEPFARPEWILAYLQNFEPQARFVLLTAWEGARLSAVLPLIRTKGFVDRIPVRKLLCPANVHSVRFSFPQVLGETGDKAMRAIWEALKRSSGWDVLEFPIYLENGPCSGIFELAARDGYHSWTRLWSESPILYMQATQDGKLDWLGGTSRHFRHELRRFQRLMGDKLGAKPQLVLHRTLEEKLKEQFFALEAAGWKGQQGSAIKNKPETQAFYEQIARVSGEAGYFFFYSYGVNGDLVAGAYGVALDGCFYPMKISYREDLYRCGPGHLMFNAIFEDCAKNAIGTIYFGGSKDRYKTMWTSDVQRNMWGFICNSNLYGSVVYEVKTRVFPRIAQCRDLFRKAMAGFHHHEEQPPEPETKRLKTEENGEGS